MDLLDVTIFTGRACLGNPGPGGYAAILECKGIPLCKPKEISGGFKNTTLDRMELMAVIEGLAAIKLNCRITIWSDSEFLVHAMNNGWSKQDTWKLPHNNNLDLWDRLMELVEKYIVKFKCIKLFNKIEQIIQCNEMAFQVAKGTQLLDDLGYKNKLISKQITEQIVEKIIATPEPRHTVRSTQLVNDLAHRNKLISKQPTTNIIKKRIVSQEPCPICGGSGKIMVKVSPFANKSTLKIMCSQCIGSGYLKEQTTE